MAKRRVYLTHADDQNPPQVPTSIPCRGSLAGAIGESYLAPVWERVMAAPLARRVNNPNLDNLAINWGRVQ